MQAVKKPKSLIILIPGALIYLGTFFSAFRYNYLLPNIESAWQYGLASFRHHPEQLYGQDVFYTYGPLSTKVVTTVHDLDTAHDFIISAILVTLILFLCLYGLFNALRTYSRRKQILFLSVFATALICTITPDILFFLTLLVMLEYLVCEPSYYKKVLASAGLVMLATYKNSFLITLVPILILIGFCYSTNKWYKKALAILGLLSMQFAALVINGIPLLKLPKFISYTTQNALAYGHFMSIDMHSKLVLAFWFLALSYVLIRLIQFIRTQAYLNTQKIAFYLGETWIIFIVLKNAITRSDVHLVLFLPFAFYLITTLLLSSPLKRIRSKYFILILALFLSGSIIALAKVNDRIDIIPTSKTKQIVTNQVTLKDVANYYSYAKFQNERKESQATLRSVNEQTKSLMSQLSTYATLRGVDLSKQHVLGFNNNIYYLPALYPVNYSYGPALQNFAAYPPRLFDNIYLEYIKTHPNYYIFWDDIAPSIDYKISSEDLPKTTRYILANYQIIATDSSNRLFMFGKKSAPQKTKKPVCRQQTGVSYFGEKTNVSNDATNLIVNPSFSGVYKLKGLVYKEPVYTIELYKQGYILAQFRVVPETLKQGLDINPLVPQLNSNLKIDFDQYVIGASDQQKTKFNFIERLCL